ncbi:MAG: hypothetical protein LUF91_06785 [Oscillospiraceae bacterium]|nr:hypothetical protein [Oscillospiraceae bacterium]
MIRCCFSLHIRQFCRAVAAGQSRDPVEKTGLWKPPHPDGIVEKCVLRGSGKMRKTEETVGNKGKPDVQKCVENVDNFLDLVVAGFLFLPRLSVRRGQTDVVKRQILKNCGVDFVKKNDLIRRSSKAPGQPMGAVKRIALIRQLN